MNPDAQEASKRGSAWLDANRPGWAQEINLRALEIEDDDYSIRGQLECGKVANLCILSEDIFEVETEQLGTTRPTAVFFEGRLVFGSV